jgi:hypothetical protein
MSHFGAALVASADFVSTSVTHQNIKTTTEGITIVSTVSSKIKLWQIDKNDAPVEAETEEFDYSNLEQRLESWIEKNPTILGEKLLIIDRQHLLSNRETIDLLAVDSEGKVVIVELKRGKPTREVIAQVLDYEASLSDYKEDELNEIATTYFEREKKEFENVREAHASIFEDKEVAFNESIRTFIVAPELDTTTEKIINYLSAKYKMDINGVTFKYYKDETGREFIIRNVVVSPEERHKRTVYNLNYHLDKADSKTKDSLNFLFDYFSKEDYRLNPTKFYISIYKSIPKADDVYVGYIKPRKTMSHLMVRADLFKPDDVSKLEKMAKNNPNFKVRYDTDWVTKENGKIVSSIKLVRLTPSIFKKYKEEIEKAIESNINYEINYEMLDKNRKKINK